MLGRIVKIMGVYPFTDINREKGLMRRYVIPPAFFIEQMLAAVDKHHPHITAATYGDVRRTTLQRDGFPEARARAFRED